MNPTLARLTASALLGRRRALVLLALPAVLLVLAVTFRLLIGPSEETTVNLLSGLAIGTLIPLLALIAGTGAIGPEIDDGSIVYLLAKPLSRHVIVRTKVLVAGALAVTLGAVPVFAAAWLTSGGDLRLATGYLAGTAAAAITYCVAFVLLAVISRNAVVVGLLYVLLWESLVGGLVPGAQALSIQQWALALTERIAAPAATEIDIDAAVSLPVGLTLLVVVTLAATWLAGHRLRSLRLSTDD
jgi:ABC-2 type transport system permease protein